jgi:hypothetical protein
MSNERIADLDAKRLTVSLECAAGELGPAVSDDPVQDPKPADDAHDKLDYGLLVDLDYRGCFRPLGELVDCDIQIPESFSPHTVNGQESGIICSICAGVWICVV